MSDFKVNDEILKQLDFILLNTSQFFKDTIIDFLTDISAGYEQEGNVYDKMIEEFLANRLRKITAAISEID